MVKKERIGFLGGTFDPIHHGHLHLALAAKERFLFDKVLFCPAFVSPFKTQQHPQVSPHHRLAMLRLALDEFSDFVLCEEEIHSACVSYTIDTLRRLQQKHPHVDFHLILGEDQLRAFARWKDFQEIIDRFSPVVGSRLTQAPFQTSLELNSKDFFSMPNLEISSTYLRERLAKRLYCKHLMPPKVVDYILEHKLYLTH